MQYHKLDDFKHVEFTLSQIQKLGSGTRVSPGARPLQALQGRMPSCLLQCLQPQVLLAGARPPNLSLHLYITISPLPAPLCVHIPFSMSLYLCLNPPRLTRTAFICAGWRPVLMTSPFIDTEGEAFSIPFEGTQSNP